MQPTGLLAFAVAGALLAGAPAASAAPSDLNGDGRSDVVLGQGEVREGAGGVIVVEGAKRRLLGTVRRLDRADLGLPGAGRYSEVGRDVATGDFDGDGTADLATGAPGAGRAGRVSVVYGSARFPAGRRAIFAGSPPSPEAFVRFGAAVAAGDLNRDGFDDLVVGDIWQDEDPEQPGQGALVVLYGSRSGLTETGRVGLDRPAPSQDSFGSLLALADVNGDAVPDVLEAATGSRDQFDPEKRLGHLTAGLGTPGGPGAMVSVHGAMEFGPASLATGDLDADGYTDVVTGVPVTRYQLNAPSERRGLAGVARIYRGGPSGLDVTPVSLRQTTPGVPGSDEAYDAFGETVAVGRIDGDRYADIVVGAPGEDDWRGRVTVIRGGPGPRGVARRGHFAVDEGTRGVPGRPEPMDRFGSSLHLLDLEGDGRRELVVGSHRRVTALRRSARGLARRGARSARIPATSR